MKKNFKIINLLFITLLLFSCGNKNSELVNAHKSMVTKSIKSSYEWMESFGLKDFASNGSTEANITFNNLGTVASNQAGKDLSSIDGLGLNFYTNSFGKKLGTEFEIALTKNSKFTSLLNLKFEKDKLLMSLPFTQDNQTFFANVTELSEKMKKTLGDEVNFEELYNGLIKLITNPITEKEYIDFYTKLIDRYFENIKIKKDGEYYTYTVTKEQSKQIIRSIYDEFITFMKKTNPMYNIKSTTKSYEEMIEKLEESEGFSYTVKQKVENDIITYSEVDFIIDELDTAKLLIDSPKGSQKISFVLKGDNQKFNLIYDGKKAGDDYNGAGKLLSNFEDSTLETMATFSVKETKDKFTWKFNTVKSEKTQDFNVGFNIDIEKGKAENKLAAMMNAGNNYKASFNGTYSVTTNQIMMSGMTELSSAELYPNIEMPITVKLNKDRIKTLKFADSGEQKNAVTLEDSELQNIGMQLAMDLSTALMELGIDTQAFMGGGF